MARMTSKVTWIEMPWGFQRRDAEDAENKLRGRREEIPFSEVAWPCAGRPCDSCSQSFGETLGGFRAHGAVQDVASNNCGDSQNAKRHEDHPEHWVIPNTR